MSHRLIAFFIALALSLSLPNSATAQVSFNLRLGPPAYTQHPNYLGDWRGRIVFYKDGRRWCSEVVRVLLEAAPDVGHFEAPDESKDELVASAFNAAKSACPQARVAVGRIQLGNGSFVYIRSEPDNLADWREVTRPQAMAGYVDPALAARRAAEARERAALAAARRQAAAILPVVDSSPWEKNGARVRRLQVDLRDLDDVGVAVLIAPSGASQMLTGGEWNGATGPGAGNASVSEKLQPGVNTLVLFIFNKEFSLGVGKWSYAFSLIGDDQVIWSSRGGRREAGVGIRYWRAFSIVKGTQAAVTVRNPTAAEMEQVTPMVDRMNKALVEKAPSADSAAMLGVASVIGQALVTSTFNSSPGSTTDECRRREPVVGGLDPNGRPIVLGYECVP